MCRRVFPGRDVFPHRRTAPWGWGGRYGSGIKFFPFFRNRKPKAGAAFGAVSRLFSAIEWLKYSIQVFARYTDTGVTHVNFYFVKRGRGNGNGDLAFGWRVVDSIFQEITDHLCERRRVTQ